MELPFERLRNYCSCCLNCGSLIAGEGLLCRPCRMTLARLEQTKIANNFPLRVVAHYAWSPGQSDLLSRLVSALKGPGARGAWKFYAKDFSRKRALTLQGRHRRICVVPAPSRTSAKKDHAYFWGEALAESLGAHFLPCLKKSSKNQQRGASRGERALVDIELNEISTEGVDIPTGTLWIFADDILTTGATARAAHFALGSPPHFEVWVFAQRRLSCGASKNLL